MDLTYRPGAVAPDDLLLNECSIRRVLHDGVAWWHMWFCVARETDGVVECFAVNLNPGGSFSENGPGGRTWGFMQQGAGNGTWQVSPSINVLVVGELHPGEHPTLPSLWHQTPAVVGVPAGEPWAP